MWKEIRKEWELLSTNAVFLIGDGRRISFWEDIWCSGEALKIAFPALFDLTVHKDARVVDIWDNTSEVGGWVPCFSRASTDWEVERLLHVLQNKKIQPNQDDMCCSIYLLYI